MESRSLVSPGASEGVLHLLDILHRQSTGISKDDLAACQGLRRLLPSDESTQHEARILLTGYALRMFAEQQEVVTALNACGVKALSLKGFTLSQLLYGELGFREFGDLDLLVPPDDAQQAYRTLESLGYIRVRPAGFSASQERAHVRYGKAQSWSRKGTQIDLHWRLLSNWVGGELLPFEELWKRSQWIETGSLPPWRTLSDQDTLVFLVFHGAQDGWTSLKQILDFGQALASLKFDWESAAELSDYRRPMFEHAVELCCRLLRIPIPDFSRMYFESDQEALEHWLKLISSRRAPQRELLAPSLMLGTSLKKARRAISSLLTPAIDDIASVNLPYSLIGLYPVVRAFRLMQKGLQRRSHTHSPELR